MPVILGYGSPTLGRQFPLSAAVSELATHGHQLHVRTASAQLAMCRGRTRPPRPHSAGHPAGTKVVRRVAIAREAAINDPLAAIPAADRAAFHGALWAIVASTEPPAG